MTLIPGELYEIFDQENESAKFNFWLRENITSNAIKKNGITLYQHDLVMFLYSEPIFNSFGKVRYWFMYKGTILYISDLHDIFYKSNYISSFVSTTIKLKKVS